MNKEKRAFNEKEAAHYISMSVSFLRQSRMSGDLRSRTPAPPFIKVGKRSVRYLRDDLDAWLEGWAQDVEVGVQQGSSAPSKSGGGENVF